MKKIHPFAAFPPEALAFLHERGNELDFIEGSIVVRRGDPGRAFWVVTEGMVEVRLTGEEGVQLPLARFGPGASFGEMALITGDPVSADVVALSAVRLLRYPAEHFARALGECESLRNHVLAQLAINLRGTSTDVWNFQQQAKALNVLMDPKREEGPLIAESGAMKPVWSQVQLLGVKRGPILVSGDPGTGKLFVAAKLHEAAGARDVPFIAVDCRSLAPGEAMKFIFGTTAFSGGATGADEGTLRRYGALQLAHRGMLVLRHADRLPLEVQEVLARYLQRQREGGLEYPSTRVIVTTTEAPAGFAQAPAVHPALAAAFGEGVIRLPRMLERRKDILPLARLFLQQTQGGRKTLSRSAEHVLVSLRYTHRHAAELREAVEMAAIIADEPQIQAEHIFAGPKDEGTVHEIDLGRFTFVRYLTSPRVLAVMRALVAVVFAAIVAASLLRSGTPAGSFANALTWGLWEPALFVLFLFVGRVWCTICPLSTAGRLAARIGNFDRPPGAWIKNYSGWYIIIGFLLVIWSEHAFRMTERPRASGLLLLALTVAAVFFAVVYRRETWCRYLCPLGNLGAIYSLPAVLNVRANPHVCATLCTTHECFKGSKKQGGCPVFHHPLYVCDAHSCKQCYQCLQACPHGSARLYLRMPLQSIWAQSDVGGALVPFALFLFFFAPAMLASQGTSWTASLPGFTSTALTALLLTVIFRPRLALLLSRDADPGPTLATRAAFSLLLLAWGPAMAYQLQHVPGLDSLRFHAAPGSVLAQYLWSGELSLLWFGQVGVTLLAGLFALMSFLGIFTRLHKEEFSQRGWNLLMTLCFCYLLGMLALIIPRGIHF